MLKEGGMWVGRKSYSVPRVPKFLYIFYNKKVHQSINISYNVMYTVQQCYLHTLFLYFVYLGDFQHITECNFIGCPLFLYSALFNIYIIG